MMSKANFILKKLALIATIIIVTGCTKDEIDPRTGQKKVYELNPQEKAKAYRDAGGGIFNTSRNKSSNNFEFSTSNILWRASLKSLDFLPLQNVDYSGGVIITDWYTSSDNFSNESIKIKIRFLSNDLAVSSIEVTSHKKICDKDGACKIVLLNNSFNDQIKEKIITQARSIKILEDKKKK
jgi:hypothetical protein